MDLAVEAVGSAAALTLCLSVTRKGGSLMVYGVFGGGEVSLDVQPVQLFELQVTGTANLLHPGAIELVPDVMLDVESLISHRLSLEELPGASAGGEMERRQRTAEMGSSPLAASGATSRPSTG